MEITDPQNVHNILSAIKLSADAMTQAVGPPTNKPFAVGFTAGYWAAVDILALALGYEAPPVEVEINIDKT